MRVKCPVYAGDMDSPMLPLGEYVPEVGEEVLVTDHLGNFLVEEIDAEQKTAVLRILRSNAVMKNVAWNEVWPVDRTRWEIVAIQRRQNAQ
jgi:hypothetical protein